MKKPTGCRGMDREDMDRREGKGEKNSVRGEIEAGPPWIRVGGFGIDALRQFGLGDTKKNYDPGPTKRANGGWQPMNETDPKRRLFSLMKLFESGG